MFTVVTANVMLTTRKNQLTMQLLRLGRVPKYFGLVNISMSSALLQRTLVITTLFVTKDCAVKFEFAVIKRLDRSHLEHQ